MSIWLLIGKTVDPPVIVSLEPTIVHVGEVMTEHVQVTVPVGKIKLAGISTAILNPLLYFEAVLYEIASVEVAPSRLGFVVIVGELMACLKKLIAVGLET